MDVLTDIGDILISELSTIGSHMISMVIKVLPFVGIIGCFMLIGLGIYAFLLISGKIW